MLSPCGLCMIPSFIYTTCPVRTEVNTTHANRTSVLSLAEPMTTDDVWFTPRRQSKCAGWAGQPGCSSLAPGNRALTLLRMWVAICLIRNAPHAPDVGWALWYHPSPISSLPQLPFLGKKIKQWFGRLLIESCASIQFMVINQFRKNKKSKK